MHSKTHTQALEKVCCYNMHGPDAENPHAKPLSNAQIWRSLRKKLGEYNQRIRSVAERRKVSNTKLMELRDKGAVSDYVAKTRMQPVPREARAKPTLTLVRRFKRKWMFSDQALNTSGKYLAKTHPRMVSFGLKYRQHLITHKLKDDMVLNMDELWKDAATKKKQTVRYT